MTNSTFAKPQKTDNRAAPKTEQNKPWVKTVERSPLGQQRRVAPETMKGALDF